MSKPFKRGDSRFWWFKFRIDGTTYQGSTKQTNKKLAEQFIHKLYTEINSSVSLGEKRPITINDAIQLYVKAQKRARRTNRISPCNRMIGVLTEPRTGKKRNVPGLPLEKKLHELNNNDLLKLHDNRIDDGYADGTIKHEFDTLKKIIKNASDRGFRTPKLDFPTIHTSKGRLRFLSKDEERLLLAETKKSRNKDLYDFTVLLLDTGVRYSELAKLPWSKVDIDSDVIFVWRNKTQREDQVVLTDRVKLILKKRLDDADSDRYVFMDKKRKSYKKYSPVALNAAIDRAGLNDPDVVEEKGGKLVWHSLRHSYASNLIQSGMSLYEVGEMLAHSDSKSTEVYSHLVKSDVAKKAVDILNKRNVEE